MSNGPFLFSATQTRVRELFEYFPETGELIRRVTAAAEIAGTRAGSLRKDGYRALVVDGVTYKEHRIIWLYMTGEWPKEDIDHVDRVKSNNRWDNLRLASRLENTRNKGKRGDSQNRFKGVRREYNKGRYGARIWVDGRNVYLGCFPTEEEAAAAYTAAARRLFGNFFASGDPSHG